MDALNPFTQVTCLLCAHTPKQEVEPLTQSEFASLYRWLNEHHLPLEALLEPNPQSLLAQVESEVRLPAQRLEALLSRGVSLAMWLERWLNAGMWLISWHDPDYPAVLRDRLGDQSPMLLYGFGNVSLLKSGGLAIVGSRNASEALLDITRTVANWCAWEDWCVISGGARGVDRSAMSGAIEQGGTCVAVLPADLARVATDSTLRESLLADKLCLVSPYHPESGFSVGNAMGRNKVIYALSDYALVISCEREKGGTWAGVVENLKRQWVPLFVYLGDEAPVDNEHLLSLGALPFPKEADQPLRQKLQQAVDTTLEREMPPRARPAQLSLPLPE